MFIRRTCSYQKENKETFFPLHTLICFIWILNLLKTAPSISLDFHMKHEQKRQWRRFGSTKSHQKIKMTDYIIHFTDSSDELIQLNSLDSWNSIVGEAKSQQHTAILEVRFTYFQAVCINSTHIFACIFPFCLFLRKVL